VLNSRTRVADEKPPAHVSLNIKEAFVRLCAYCAYQERSRSEIMEKMQHYGLEDEEKQALMIRLEEENFYNEQRFANAYAGGKFRMQHWGRLKIKQGLKARGIGTPEINRAMGEEIPDEAYFSTLMALLYKKKQGLFKDPTFMRKQKLVNYALGKGYELDLVLHAVSEII
jgi:regulatory protein